METGQQEKIAVIVPTLNEEKHIAACLQSLISGIRGYAGDILVLDGGSRDRTCAIVSDIASRHPEVRLIPNPARLQSAGVNLGAQSSPDATILIRADAHADYPADFIAQCVRALRTQNATSVVVPMITEGKSPMQRAIAAAQNSKLGNGGSAHRSQGTSRFVEHGHHAAFDRAFFTRLGGYDERFTHNEDAELDVRAVAAGGRIWMCCDAAITYIPRDRLIALAKQYFRHGQGRARTTMLHRQPPRPRQMAPVVALAGCVVGLLLAMIHPIFLLLPLLYAAICFSAGLSLAVTNEDFACVLSGAAAMVMHLSWAVGFLCGLVRFSRISPRIISGDACISSS